MDTTPLTRYFHAKAPAGVLAAYLFGSHAEGRAHRESDVDIGVLLDRARHPKRENRAEIGILVNSDLVSVVHCNDVQVVILNDAPPELGRHIVTHGLRVFCQDPEADHAFLRDVQLRAADLVPWLRRMRAIKLRALQE